MATLLTILIFIAAILLILLVLVQNSKGGGLAAGFSSGNQVMGAPRTADFLEKASWTLAAVIVLLSIFTVGLQIGQTKQHETIDEDSVQQEVIQEDNADAAPAADEAAEK
jgi:preprotein translocase subunit SecG